MQYIDSGARSPDQAVGHWLRALASEADEIGGLHLQTGFFGADALKVLDAIVERLTNADAPVSILVGSNDGLTSRSEVEQLLEIVGPPREGLLLGVVSFINGYFHPKCFHFTRSDGSMTAYVGSANLTRSGITALHIEAGLLLDTRDGDDSAVLTRIGEAIDQWFTDGRDGLYVVRDQADIDILVESRVLGVERPPAARRSPAAGAASGSRDSGLASLKPLVQLPSSTTSGPPASRRLRTPPYGDAEAFATTIFVLEDYRKRLTASDAQRKKAGNQRGSITLVRGRYQIDPQTYFRDEFFRDATWLQETTRTGQLRERAVIPMQVSITGVNIGLQDIEVTHAPNRESGQGNYVSLVHLGVMAPYFAAEDLTARELILERRSDGSFSLTIE